VRGVAVADDLDLVQGLADLAKVLGRQLHVGRRHVLLQASHLRRTGDGDDPGLLRQEPGERDLRRRRLLLRGDRAEALDERLVRLA
jgi:hypothetical protein